MRLGTRQECIESLLRVSGTCQDGTREFAGRRSSLAGRLSGVAERLVGSWGGVGFSAELQGEGEENSRRH
ncbi:hypothetical protein BHE74_00028120 [Ensete ventricosum]|nr:hypothetical protein BHE74_00028120 [Ensete ventricosum]